MKIITQIYLLGHFSYLEHPLVFQIVFSHTAISSKQYSSNIKKKFPLKMEKQAPDKFQQVWKNKFF